MALFPEILLLESIGSESVSPNSLSFSPMARFVLKIQKAEAENKKLYLKLLLDDEDIEDFTGHFSVNDLGKFVHCKKVSRLD